MNLAIELSQFLRKHIERIFAISPERGLSEAHALAKKIFSKEINEGDSIRTISRHHWKNIITPYKVELGLSVLEKLNWLKIEKSEPTKGRPTETVHINPALFQLPSVISAEMI